MKWVFIFASFFWLPCLGGASTGCDAQASSYFMGDSNLASKALGARTWRLLALKKRADQGDDCGKALLARALQESKDYWHHIAKKYACPESPAPKVGSETCPSEKLQAVTTNLNYLRLIEFGSLETSDETASAKTQKTTEAAVCDGNCEHPTSSTMTKHQVTNVREVAKVVTQIPPPKSKLESPPQEPAKTLKIVLVDRSRASSQPDLSKVVARNFRPITLEATPVGQPNPQDQKRYFESLAKKPESASQRYQLAHQELLKELDQSENDLKAGLARKTDRLELVGLQNKVINLRNKRASLEAAWNQFTKTQGE